MVHQGSVIYFRAGTIYLATQYFNRTLGTADGAPVFTFPPSIQMFSAYLPASLRASAFVDEQFIQHLRDKKTNALWKAAKVRSWRRLEAGAALGFIYRSDEHYRVERFFPDQRPGRGYIGKKTFHRRFFRWVTIWR